MTTTMLRRTMLHGLGLAPFAARAQATAWPERPVRIVVPYSAGGGTDITARAATQRMAPDLGQPIVVDNRAGANTAIGAEHVARARPDGYTLIVSGSTTFVLLPLLSRTLPYRPAEFAPVSRLTEFPMAAVVGSRVEGGLTDLVERIRRAPADFTYAHTGIGSSGHLMGERLFMNHGLRIQSIPYRGFAQTLVDMMSGQIPLTFESVPAVMPYHREGRLRIVAVSSPQRWPSLPDVPTFAELGYATMAFVGWFGLLAPGGTPAPIVQRLADSVAKARGEADYRAAIEATGQQVVTDTPEGFANFIAADTAAWRAVIEPLNLRLD